MGRRHAEGGEEEVIRMTRRKYFPGLLFAAGASVVALAGGGWAQTKGAVKSPAKDAAEVAAQHVAAMGGEKNFQKIHSVVVTGELRFPDGSKWTVTVHHVAPDLLRIDLDNAGRRMTQAFDGTTGWKAEPGSPEPQKLSGDELAYVEDQAENAIGDPLLDYQARGNQISLGEDEVVGGTPCAVVNVTMKSGDAMKMYLSRKDYLEVKEVLPRKINGKEEEIDESVQSYKKFGAFYLPSVYVSGLKGSTQLTALSIANIEFNAEIDRSIFRFPNTGTPAAPSTPTTEPPRSR
jgi:hypothetical protein